jgi:hypothetical protein
MSITSDRFQRAAAVLLGGGVLLFSAVAGHDLAHIVPERTTRTDIENVRNAELILRAAFMPIQDVQPCDAIKSLFPDKFKRADGDLKMTTPTSKPVILCFKNDIDYSDALTAAGQRGLSWTTGIGGDTVVAFAPSEAIFRDVMRRNGVTFRAGDLPPWSPFLDGLRAKDGAYREGGAWFIKPADKQTEALFGPYVSVSAGPHRVDLTFAPARAGDCAAMAKERLWLAVTRDHRTQGIVEPVERPLEAQPGSQCLYKASIDFESPPGGAHEVETPIWVQGLATMRIMTYKIAPIAADPSSAPAAQD